MNTSFLPVNDLFKNRISKITAADIPECGRYTDEKSRLTFFSLEEIINSIGKRSTEAQGLKRVITTFDKLRLFPNHILYLLKDENGNGGTGEIIGLLKVGEKKLYLYDRQGKLKIATPMCVLDFYVIESRQGAGLGKMLFDHMLEDLKLTPYELPIDGPSVKMLGFLKHHYNYTKIIKQSNNFAVCDQFFESENVGSSRPEQQIEAPHSYTHYWQSEAGSVIQGGSSSSSNLSYKSNESEASISEADGETSEERWEVAAPPPGPQLESLDLSADDKTSSKPPERPSTLSFENLNIAEGEATVEPSKATSSDHSDSQLTDQGYVDLKFHHKKLW
ncbi:Alpha-tubulin N-acetyltransferase [Papilio xuthus]|uniref:Alpha-tubulin N-acetyltransferase n=1 Tax=Papilio xuthus TaxID=66420 RepID=A0A194PH04_PAPXU|nr:Alpha-tubulin N-acetyltransferase [Papilio xuthus]